MARARPAHAAVSDHQIAAVRVWARANPRVQQVRLFGSRCKGTHHPASGIDLAVTAADDGSFTRVAIWVFHQQIWADELSSLLGAQANVRITDVAYPCQIRAQCAECSVLLYDALVARG